MTAGKAPGGRAELADKVAGPALILEDEALVAMDLQLILRDMGLAVCGIAARKRHALAIARQNELGLILADVQLADGDNGIDTVKEILRERDVPVIFVTAFPESLLGDHGIEGAPVLSKPYSPEAVKAVIEGVLHGYGSAP